MTVTEAQKLKEGDVVETESGKRGTVEVVGDDRHYLVVRWRDDLIEIVPDHRLGPLRRTP